MKCPHCDKEIPPRKTTREIILDTVKRSMPDGVDIETLVKSCDVTRQTVRSRIERLCCSHEIHLAEINQKSVYLLGKDPAVEEMRRMHAESEFRRKQQKVDFEYLQLLNQQPLVDLTPAAQELWIPVEIPQVNVGQRFHMNWFNRRYFAECLEKDTNATLIKIIEVQSTPPTAAPPFGDAP